jgi:ABC-type transporter Mla subunit MlaD
VTQGYGVPPGNRGSSDRLDRLEAILVQLAEQVVANQQQTTENSQAIQATSRDLAVLVDQQSRTRQDLDRLTNITERYINASTTVIQRLDEGIAKLRAGQEQQARILDQLIRREQNGGQ